MSTDGYFSGIDISSLQGSISDFTSLGADFVIHRAFVGNDYGDPNYAGNVKAIRAVNIPVAAYNFVYPIGLPNDATHTARDANGQAELHFGFVGGDTFAFADLEWPLPSSFAVYECSPAQICDWTLAYLQRYEELSGFKCGLYTYPWFGKSIGLGSRSEFSAYPLWLANYTQSSMVIDPWTDWAVWQTSGSAHRLPNGVVCDTDKCKDLSIFSM
jgi:GH25 family lysozyme M1 (1,4-beta-N-acetylmuramidase)